MKRFNEDFLKRTEAARRSGKRAEARLHRIVTQPGGYEDEMKYQLAEMTRQENLLRRELIGLKLERIKAAANYEKTKNEGVIHIAQSNLNPHSDTSTEHDFDASSTGVTNSHGEGKDDYGKDYHGYRSAPGSFVSHTKKVHYKDSNSESSVEEMQVRAGTEAMKLRASHKLKEQQVHNKSLQNKLNAWKKNSEPREKLTMKTPANQRHLSYLRREMSRSAISDPTPEVTSKQQKSKKQAQVEREIGKVNLQQYKLPPLGGGSKLPAASRKDNEELSEAQTEQLQELIRKADDVIFDENVYAPDGRVRKMHRMPEFRTSLDQAKQARYVRTKHKREFEINLTTSQVFG